MKPIALKTRISTPRLAETVRFYHTVLGMRVIETWNGPDDNGCVLSLCGGGTEALLEVHHDEEVEDFSGLSLQFRTGDLDAFLASIPANVWARGPVERPWGSRYAWLTDPNGIGLIVYEGRV